MLPSSEDDGAPKVDIKAILIQPGQHVAVLGPTIGQIDALLKNAQRPLNAHDRMGAS